MNKGKKEHHGNKYGCFLLTIFSIIFITSFIIEQINLGELIPDFEEQKSELSVQYNDKMSLNNSFVSFTNFNSIFLNTSIFSEQMTQSNWNPKKVRNDVENRSSLFNNNCQKCGTEYQNPVANSSSRDLVISYFSGLSVFKLRFISALRAAGCQATIAIFISNPAQQLFPSLNTITDNCGVLVFQVDEFQEPYSTNKEISSHILIHEFLKEYRAEFDRVIIFDCESVIIQSDPFTTYFTYNTVGVPTTNYQDTISYDDEQTISPIDPSYTSDFYSSRSPLLKSSILYGSVDGLLMFYGIVFNHSNLAKSQFDNPLSSYINYFYHRGIFEQKGLKLFIAIPGNFICSIESSENMKMINNYYFASPFDKKWKNYFTSKYYREKHIMHTVLNAMNPPAVFTISKSDPFASIHFYGCSNILYKKRTVHKKNNFSNTTKKSRQRRRR